MCDPINRASVLHTLFLDLVTGQTCFLCPHITCHTSEDNTEAPTIPILVNTAHSCPSFLHFLLTLPVGPDCTLSLPLIGCCCLPCILSLSPNHIFDIKLDITRQPWRQQHHFPPKSQQPPTKLQCHNTQDHIWHSEDRASWHISTIKANKMHYFSTLFW